MKKVTKNPKYTAKKEKCADEGMPPARAKREPNAKARKK